MQQEELLRIVQDTHEAPLCSTFYALQLDHNIMITATIKTLNGELIEIHHNPVHGFSRFIDMVYDALPTIPYGCLVLRRAVSEDHIRTLFHRVLEELENLFEKWSKPMTDDLPYKERVTRVMDGDYFYAVADLSLVRPVVFRDATARLICDDNTVLDLQTFYVDFYSTTEYDPINDEYMYVYGDLCIAFDKKHHLFTLEDLLEESIDSRARRIYFPKGQTQWYLSVIECLESIPDARFPQNEETLISIRKQIDAQS